MTTTRPTNNWQTSSIFTGRNNRVHRFLFQSPYLDPVSLTSTRVRFDTTNPPANEVQCIEHIKALLDNAGI